MDIMGMDTIQEETAMTHRWTMRVQHRVLQAKRRCLSMQQPTHHEAAAPSAALPHSVTQPQSLTAGSPLISASPIKSDSRE